MQKPALVVVGIAGALAFTAAYAKRWWPFSSAKPNESSSATSIKPTHHVQAELLLPDVDGAGDPVVEAELWAPTDYEVSSLGNEARLNRQASPEIELRSRWAGDGTKAVGFVNRDCSGSDVKHPGQPRVIRAEERHDGWLAQCHVPYTLDDGRSYAYTLVVRNVHLRGTDVQCLVTFSQEDEPSSARLTDATAICDSLNLREPTTDEVAKMWSPTALSSSRGVRLIKPTHRYRGRLALDGGIAANVEILAPEGYDMKSEPNVISLHRPNSPSIDVLGGWPEAPRFADTQCGGIERYPSPKQTRVLRSEHRPDGWIAVCEFVEEVEGSEPHSDETITVVARDTHWSGAEVQCIARFDADDRPTRSRLDDTLAICDSLHFTKAAAGDDQQKQSASVRPGQGMR
jgi:hypothetical protein